MKKRLGALLLALALVLSMAPNGLVARAEAAEQPRLMFYQMDYDQSTNSWYENANMGPLDLSDPGIPVGSNLYLRLYYGTRDSVVPLTEGTLKSSNEKVIQISSTTDRSRDGDPYYVMDSVGFGTTTLTYTNGTTTYSATATNTLPTWSSFYSVQSRTQGTYIYETEYDANTGTTVWLMQEGGYTAAQTQNLTVTLEDNI